MPRRPAQHRPLRPGEGAGRAPISSSATPSSKPLIQRGDSCRSRSARPPASPSSASACPSPHHRPSTATRRGLFSRVASVDTVARWSGSSAWRTPKRPPSRHPVRSSNINTRCGDRVLRRDLGRKTSRRKRPTAGGPPSERQMAKRMTRFLNYHDCGGLANPRPGRSGPRMTDVDLTPAGSRPRRLAQRIVRGGRRGALAGR